MRLRKVVSALASCSVGVLLLVASDRGGADRPFVRSLNVVREKDGGESGNVLPTFADATGKLVLATQPRSISEESADAVRIIKFHLRCIADVAQNTSVHIVVYTSDEAVGDYVRDAELPLQVVKIEKKDERNFSSFIKDMPSRWPDATGYGWFNGDICPSPSFVEAADKFNTASCPKANDDKSRWRFTSGLRLDIPLHLVDPESPDPLRTLRTAAYRARPYSLLGVDFFAWNRAMLIEHIIPTIPDFSMPLHEADQYLFLDASCNALVLMPALSVHTAKLFHINHKEDRRPLGQYGTKDTILFNNREEASKVDFSSWKRGRELKSFDEVLNSISFSSLRDGRISRNDECGLFPKLRNSDCSYRPKDGEFDCNRNGRDVGICISEKL